MKKQWFGIFLTLCLCIIWKIPGHASEDTKIYVDGDSISYEQDEDENYLIYIPSKNYEVRATLYNPTEEVYEVVAWDERGRQSKKKNLQPKEEKNLIFQVAVLENRLTLSFQAESTTRAYSLETTTEVYLTEKMAETYSAEKAAGEDSVNLIAESFCQESILVKCIDIRSLPEVKNDTLTLHLVGDSIMQSYGEGIYPRQGIGQKLYQYFDYGKLLWTDKKEGNNQLNSCTLYGMKNMQIQNWSVAGQSTKSFWEKGYFDNILCNVGVGDYVLVHLGHNDALRKEEEYRTSVADYEENLKVFIRGCQERGAVCILLPAPPIGKFKNGSIKTCPVSYKKALQRVAKETGSVFVDTAKAIRIFMNTLGKDQAQTYYMILEPGKYVNYPDGLTDRTHFNGKGADKLAQITAALLKENKALPETFRNRITVDSDYYKGTFSWVSKTKITRKKGKYTLTWKKKKEAKNYVLYQYNKKTKTYKKVAKTKKNTYTFSKKYTRNQVKNIKIKAMLTRNNKGTKKN